LTMQFAMLCIVQVLSLNGQEPISFQAVAGYFFGLALPLALSSVIQRVFWPTLPQWDVRDRFLELNGIGLDILSKGPDLPLWQKTRMALIPGETLSRIQLLQEPTCPPGEQDLLVRTLQEIGRACNNLLAAKNRLHSAFPKKYLERSAEEIARLEGEFENAFRQLGKSFRLDCPAGAAELAGRLEIALSGWLDYLAGVRREMLAGGESPNSLLKILGLAGRYALAGESLKKAGKLTASLRLPLYMGDYSL